MIIRPSFALVASLVLAALLGACERRGVQSDRSVETPAAGHAAPEGGTGITGPTPGAGGTGNAAGAGGSSPRAGAGSAASAPDAGMASAAAVPQGTLAPSLSSAESAFMAEAASSGLFEVELASLATRKAADESIKKLALALAAQQSGTNDELKIIAKQHRVPLPEQLRPEQRAALDRLAKLEGASFDREFLALGIEDRQAAIRRLEEAMNAAKDPGLRNWMERTLPILKDHLARAQKIPAPQAADEDSREVPA